MGKIWLNSSVNTGNTSYCTPPSRTDVGGEGGKTWRKSTANPGNTGHRTPPEFTSIDFPSLGAPRIGF